MKTKIQDRVIIENIEPTINCGLYPVCRVIGEDVIVKADVLSDGHDSVQCVVLYKHERERKWREVRMKPLENDRWTGHFTVEKQGRYEFKVQGWVDHALNWQHGLIRKLEDNQHVASELLEGEQYVQHIKKHTKGVAKKLMKQAAVAFTNQELYEESIEIAKSSQLTTLFKMYPQKPLAVESDKFAVYVDREKARFSTWYEFFPRSASQKKGEHGTFKDCVRLLPRVADMGFDVLYFPPIHPIGEQNRKGRNNAEKAEDGDSGSPWGIGSKEGGHKSIHPQLGTLDDFKHLIEQANEHGIEIAMDIAFQAAPDHPYVKSNPKWFKWRPDGTVQYAENPPKKYQDILPIYFESDDWKSLWDEMLSIILYWVDKGITIFRIDNPHTKPFHFWGWLIQEVKRKHPDVLFLSEAFTKPKVMQQLAKQGFTQSYTYFTWRNDKQQLQEYVTELTRTEMKEYFRPNFWPNTPDINPWELQSPHESTYLFRHFLAATLSSNYGIYGPVFEFMDYEAYPGKEEYNHSEKYEIRHWDWEKETKLSQLIKRINTIRKQEEALQQTNNIQFLETENEHLMAYVKWNDSKDNFILCVVNIAPFYRHKGMVHVPREIFGIEGHQSLQMHDLITKNTYTWNDFANYVALDPHLPYHLFRVTW